MSSLPIGLIFQHTHRRPKQVTDGFSDNIPAPGLGNLAEFIELELRVLAVAGCADPGVEAGSDGRAPKTLGHPRNVPESHTISNPTPLTEFRGPRRNQRKSPAAGTGDLQIRWRRRPHCLSRNEVIGWVPRALLCSLQEQPGTSLMATLGSEASRRTEGVAASIVSPRLTPLAPRGTGASSVTDSPAWAALTWIGAPQSLLARLQTATERFGCSRPGFSNAAMCRAHIEEGIVDHRGVPRDGSERLDHERITESRAGSQMGVVEPDPAPERLREAASKRARLWVQECGHDEIEPVRALDLGEPLGQGMPQAAQDLE